MQVSHRSNGVYYQRGLNNARASTCASTHARRAFERSRLLLLPALCLGGHRRALGRRARERPGGLNAPSRAAAFDTIPARVTASATATTAATAAGAT